MHFILKTALAAAAVCALTGGAFAYSPHPDRLTGRGAMSNLPPLAYQLFCLQNPSECKAGGSGEIAADSALMSKLTRVNVAVNTSMTPRNDPHGDVWTVGASVGDCEDYALNKRHALVKLGVPASALRMAVVLTPSGDGHAVLIVHTVRGDYVLDNLTNAIRPFEQTGLHMVSMAGANPDDWNS